MNTPFEPALCSYTNDPARRPESCQGSRTRSVTSPRTRGEVRNALPGMTRERPLARLYANGILRIMIRLNVNGNTHDIDAAPDTALLYVLRNDLELNGPKYGCGLGECGTCAVLIDGVAARSCVIPVDGCVGRDIVTLEGLGTRERPDPVQEAFIDEQAAQCGYCLNGMIMSVKALLLRSRVPSPSSVTMSRPMQRSEERRV